MSSIEFRHPIAKMMWKDVKEWLGSRELQLDLLKLNAILLSGSDLPYASEAYKLLLAIIRAYEARGEQEDVNEEDIPWISADPVYSRLEDLSLGSDEYGPLKICSRATALGAFNGITEGAKTPIELAFMHVTALNRADSDDDMSIVREYLRPAQFAVRGANAQKLTRIKIDDSATASKVDSYILALARAYGTKNLRWDATVCTHARLLVNTFIGYPWIGTNYYLHRIPEESRPSWAQGKESINVGNHDFFLQPL